MARPLRLALPALLAATWLLAFTAPAPAAEDTIRGTTATTQPHPELAPRGIRRGGYIFYPSFVYAASYNDNVFATESDKKSSRVSEYSPALAAVSNWNRHALNFNASVDIGENHRFSSEDYTDWLLETNGTLDIRHDMNLAAGASLSREHIDRSAPDETRGIEPTEFDRTRIFARYRQKFGRFSAGVNLNLVRNVYDDVEAIQLGVPVTIDNSRRDRTQTRLRLRGDYNYVGNQNLFVTIEKIDRDYDESDPPGGVERSSGGHESQVGLSFDYHGILLGQVSIGYRDQDYDGPLPDIDSPLAEASILWNITDLTTLNLGLDYEIVESIQSFVSGYESRVLSLGVNHELRRDLTLGLTLVYTRDDYQTIEPFARDDSTYYLAANSIYKMNRNLYFGVSLVREDRTSDFDIGLGSSDEFNFTRNLISFTLLAQF